MNAFIKSLEIKSRGEDYSINTQSPNLKKKKKRKKKSTLKVEANEGEK